MIRRKRKIWPVHWSESLAPCRSLVCLLSPCGHCHTELLAVSIAPSPPTPYSDRDGRECLFLRLASSLGSMCQALFCCRNFHCHLLWGSLARDFQWWEQWNLCFSVLYKCQKASHKYCQSSRLPEFMPLHNFSLLWKSLCWPLTVDFKLTSFVHSRHSCLSFLKKRPSR